MERYTDSQYDDDLTVGVGDNEESFDTGYVDLFEFSGDEESPIARLKTIVLSIDWEITDEVLTQFNEELLDLKDIWAGDEINLVYVQALEKISKYIFQQKSDSHPNAIKLLLTFYYDLEKIVLNTDLSEDEKKEILREDVKKFEQLKRQIGILAASKGEPPKPRAEVIPAATITDRGEPHPTLFALKACILGMDWEITDRELGDLGREVRKLEGEFSAHKARMIFLQGIGALGGYIKWKKSDAHADAFKLLYSFYEGLEKIVVGSFSREEEKAILLQEVEKFEAFKRLIAPTITPEALKAKAENREAASAAEEEIAPAFAELPEDVQGFQADEEAAALVKDQPVDVESRLDNFFREEAEEPAAAPGLPPDAARQIDSFFAGQTDEGIASVVPVSAEEALRGVDVETDADDDSEEEALPVREDGRLAPALADTETEEGAEELVTGLPAAAESEGEAAEIEERLGGFFGGADEEDRALDRDMPAALAGVAVETEADDDSGEEPLPFTGEDLAPALSDDDLFGGTEEEGEVVPGSGEGIEIADQVAGFFADEAEAVGDAAQGYESDEALVGDVEDRLESFFPDEEEVAPVAAPAPDFADQEAGPAAEAPAAEESIEDRLESFFGAEEGDEEEDLLPVFSEEEPPAETERASDLSAAREEAAEEEAEEEAAEPDEDEAEAVSVADELAAAPVFSLPDEEEDEEEELVAFEAVADDEEALPPVEELPVAALEEVVEDALPPVEELPVAALEEVVEEALPPVEELPVAALEAGDEEESPVAGERSSFGSDFEEEEFFADIDTRVEEPGEFRMELLDEEDELEAAAPAVQDEADDEEEFEIDLAEPDREDSGAPPVPEADEDFPVFTPAGDDLLVDLRAGIASLGVEISDVIIQGILGEINKLRHRMISRPIEKTFLQLLSTIVQHIGQYRYESSAEAHGLLLSVFDKLDLLQSGQTEDGQAQEILLAETCKVLLWQQKMLDRQAVRKGGQLTFLDPVRAEVAVDQTVPEVSEELRAELASRTSAADAVSQSETERDFSAVFEAADQDEEETPPGGAGDTSFRAIFEAADDDEESGEDDRAARQTAEEFETLLSELEEKNDGVVDFAEAISEVDEILGDAAEVHYTEEFQEAGGPLTDEEEAMAGIQPFPAIDEDTGLADLVRKEIAALKESLQAEIKELRNQLKERE